MKFGQKLDANKHLDWPYVSYKALKKLIKDLLGKKHSVPPTPDVISPLVARRSKAAAEGGALEAPLLANEAASSAKGADSPEIAPVRDGFPVSPRDAFWAALDGERTKVHDFYVSEVERHREQLTLLVEQLDGAGRDNRNRGRSSLQRASTDLYRTLQHLTNYCILNYTAMLKVAKKFDKAVAEVLPALKLQNEYKQHLDSTSSFPTHLELDELCAQVTPANGAPMECEWSANGVLMEC